MSDRERRITATQRPLENESSVEITVDKDDGVSGTVAFLRFAADLLETTGAIKLTVSTKQPEDRPGRPTRG